MSKKKLGPGTYTRGWETFGHYLSMLRSSLRIHLAISLIGGVLLGSLWFYSNQDDRVKSNFGQYIKASLLSRIRAEKPAEYDLGDGTKKIPSIDAYDYLRANVFGHRTMGFMARQWTFRLVVCLICFLALSGVIIMSKGRRLSKDTHRRGARVVDITEQTKIAKRRAFLLVLALSIVLGTAWSWISLGSEGRSTIASYFWSSTYLAFSPAASLASPDSEDVRAWYSLPPGDGFYNTAEVNNHLRSAVFNGHSMSRLALLWLARIVGILSIGVLFLAWRRRQQKTEMGLKLAGVPIPPSTECSHFLFSGSPGSGKSTAIKEILDQVRDRGERAIVYDPSGEYIGPYYREGKDVIMNPLDSRSELWTLWADVWQKTDYTTIARSLFPAGGQDRFWNDAGAALFAASAERLEEIGKRSNERLYELLTTSAIEELAGFLKGTSASKFLDPGAGAMPANLIASVTSRLSAWKLLPDPISTETEFSIRRFIEEDESDSWMFLSMRQDHRASLKPLVSLWCDLAATSILSLPPSRSRRVWVVLDEVASLQRLPALEPLLAQGRKYGAAVIIGLQSIPQLRNSYGRDAAAALASQPQTWLALRTVEPDTARWLEHALGEAEIDETREAVSMGADDIRDGVSIQQNLRKKSAAMASEIMTLPDLAGYLKLPGSNPVYRVAIELKERRISAPIYMPRTSP